MFFAGLLCNLHSVEINDNIGEGMSAYTVYETQAQDIKGIFVVVSGLNVKASAMGSAAEKGTLVNFFTEAGYDAVVVSLSGQSENIEAMKNAGADIWLNEAYNAYCKAKILSQTRSGKTGEELPVYLAAFSLGALVFEVLINSKTEVPVVFEKSVFFAPAVAMRRITHAVFILDIFVKDDFVIKSKSPPYYRANYGTSMAAYKALFELEKKLLKTKFALSNSNTLIFIDPKDELISSAELKKQIKKFGLTNWELVKIDAKTKSAYKFHHLIIDEQRVGQKTWEQITLHIKNFLQTG
jgi:esterase/lipase